MLAVLIFHLFGPILPGGYAGVDVFFVISGYLITRNLFDDIRSPKGLSILEFYHRRMRRIAPAALLVVVTTLIAGFFVLVPGDYAELGESALFSAFGLGNFYFYNQTGYFDPKAEMQPLLHMWSLGVEEQFYVIWPLLLAGLIWVARGARSTAAMLIGIVAAMSLATWLYELTTKPTYAFYHPHTRAWELAAGALLVFLPAIRSRAVSEVMATAGLLLVGTAVLFTGWPLHDLNVAPAVAGAALLVWPKQPTAAGRLLATPPMRGIGLISFSLYLWHWPLIVFFRHYTNGASPTLAEGGWIAAASFALALLTYRFIETPMRRPWRSPIKAIGAGIVGASLTAILAGTVHQTGGFESRLEGEAANMTSRDRMWEWNCPNSVTIAGLGGSFCTIGAPWEGAAVRGILWGDSHAGHFAPMVEAAVMGQPISILLYENCPAIIGNGVPGGRPNEPGYNADCERSKSAALTWLRANEDVRVVIFASAWFELATALTKERAMPANLDGEALVATGLSSILKEAASPGRKMVIVDQVPNIGTDPAPCIVSGALNLMRQPCSDLGRGAAATYARTQAKLTTMIAKIASARLEDTYAILPAKAACTDMKCIVSLNGQFLYRDHHHLRRNLSSETRQAYASLIGLTEALKAFIPSSAD